MSSRAGALLILLLPLSAAAQAPDTLLGCRALRGDAQRLACYDRLVDAAQAPAVEQAPAGVQAAVPQSAEPPPSLGERQFGRSTAGGDRDLRKLYGVEDIASLVAEVASIEHAADRTLEITLVNGQVWRQKGAAPISLHVGDRVRIDRGALGAYYLRRESGGRTISVKRTK